MLDGLLLRVVHSHIMLRRWMPTRVLCVISSRLSWLKRPSKSTSQVRSTLPRDSGASDGHGEGGASREGSDPCIGRQQRGLQQTNVDQSHCACSSS